MDEMSFTNGNEKNLEVSFEQDMSAVTTAREE
jgi:hypothetical protein